MLSKLILEYEQELSTYNNMRSITEGIEYTDVINETAESLAKKLEEITAGFKDLSTEILKKLNWCVTSVENRIQDVEGFTDYKDNVEFNGYKITNSQLKITLPALLDLTKVTINGNDETFESFLTIESMNKINESGVEKNKVTEETFDNQVSKILGITVVDATKLRVETPSIDKGIQEFYLGNKVTGKLDVKILKNNLNTILTTLKYIDGIYLTKTVNSADVIINNIPDVDFNDPSIASLLQFINKLYNNLFNLFGVVSNTFVLIADDCYNNLYMANGNTPQNESAGDIDVDDYVKDLNKLIPEIREFHAKSNLKAVMMSRSKHLDKMAEYVRGAIKRKWELKIPLYRVEHCTAETKETVEKVFIKGLENIVNKYKRFILMTPEWEDNSVWIYLTLREPIEEPKETIQEAALTQKEKDALKDSDFGLPSLRQYPIHDETHILKAIQFFHFCKSENKQELANNICTKVTELGLVGKVHVSTKNPNKKYFQDWIIKDIDTQTECIELDDTKSDDIIRLVETITHNAVTGSAPLRPLMECSDIDEYSDFQPLFEAVDAIVGMSSDIKDDVKEKDFGKVKQTLEKLKSWLKSIDQEKAKKYSIIVLKLVSYIAVNIALSKFSLVAGRKIAKGLSGSKLPKGLGVLKDADALGMSFDYVLDYALMIVGLYTEWVPNLKPGDKMVNAINDEIKVIDRKIKKAKTPEIAADLEKYKKTLLSAIKTIEKGNIERSKPINESVELFDENGNLF